MRKSELRDTVIVILLCVAGLATIARGGALVGQRTAGRITLNLTPQAIGNNAGREELIIKVDSNSSNPAYCGYDSATVSQTPGATSGERIAPGQGETICKYPDQETYCISIGAVLSFNEAYVRTATNTATPTITPTP